MNLTQGLIALSCQVWLFSGFIINLVQAILWLTIRRINIGLYHQLNYYVTYACWSQLVFIAEYLTNSTIRVYFADDETEKQFAREHSIGVYNHKYEIDWFCSWIVFDKFGCLAVC